MVALQCGGCRKYGITGDLKTLKEHIQEYGRKCIMCSGRMYLTKVKDNGSGWKYCEKVGTLPRLRNLQIRMTFKLAKLLLRASCGGRRSN